MDQTLDPLFSNVRRIATDRLPPVCCMVVDAEEDFDWDRPGYAVGYSTDCMRRITELQSITRAYKLRPSYLLTYPVLEDPDVIRIIRGQLEREECEVGLQLHPWVTPPLTGDSTLQASYLGGLDAATEERKLVNLIERFRHVFSMHPVTFRAGRYGLSPATAMLLEKHGMTVDTSIAPRTNISPAGGPDFSAYGCEPFWFGKSRPVLEVPLCRDLVGWAGPLAPFLYGMAASHPLASRMLQAALSRTRCAERITLSPEGNDIPALRRLLRSGRRKGQSVFTLSFHSSSLALGRNPYVQTRADLHQFYDRMSAVLDTMAAEGFGFAPLSRLPGILGGAP